MVRLLRNISEMKSEKFITFSITNAIAVMPAHGNLQIML